MTEAQADLVPTTAEETLRMWETSDYRPASNTLHPQLKQLLLAPGKKWADPTTEGSYGLYYELGLKEPSNAVFIDDLESRISIMTFFLRAVNKKFHEADK